MWHFAAYGCAADMIDASAVSLRQGSRIAFTSFHLLSLRVFEDGYVRTSSEEETTLLYNRAENLESPETIGAIYRCKCVSKNSPVGHHRQLNTKERFPTVTMEAEIVDYLYIWHVFFGVSGCVKETFVPDISTITPMIVGKWILFDFYSKLYMSYNLIILFVLFV